MAEGKRILVVDDDPECRAALRALLEAWGHHVDEAADGQAAVAAALDGRPEIVLLDVGLPDLSGYDVAEKIRAATAGALYIVALTTGWDEDAAGRPCFDAYVVKPADPERLRALLATSSR